MIMNKLRAMKAKKGFTLVELIVVIAIIAILAAILIPLLGNYISDSQRSANAASAKNYAGQIEVKIQEAMNIGGGIDPDIVIDKTDAADANASIDGFATGFLASDGTQIAADSYPITLKDIFGTDQGNINVVIEKIQDKVTGKDRYAVDVLYLQDGTAADGSALDSGDWSDGTSVIGHYGTIR
jgi:prepilin-type N-terminal cleavage/methylation domain-containing protein